MIENFCNINVKIFQVIKMIFVKKKNLSRKLQKKIRVFLLKYIQFAVKMKSIARKYIFTVNIIRADLTKLLS